MSKANFKTKISPTETLRKMKVNSKIKFTVSGKNRQCSYQTLKNIKTSLSKEEGKEYEITSLDFGMKAEVIRLK